MCAWRDGRRVYGPCAGGAKCGGRGPVAGKLEGILAGPRTPLAARAAKVASSRGPEKTWFQVGLPMGLVLNAGSAGEVVRANPWGNIYGEACE